MTPGDTPSNIPPEEKPDEDDILDLELEDVLDLTPAKDSSSASAIEGVEMLDFLDDDDSPESEGGEETDTGNAPLEMTIDMGSVEAAKSPAAADAEIENIDELETADVVDVGDDVIEDIPIESLSDTDVADPVQADDEEIPVIDDAVEIDDEDPDEAASGEASFEATAGEVVEPIDEAIAEEFESMEDTVEDVDDFLEAPVDVVDSDEGKEPSEATVNHTREPTAITAAPVISFGESDDEGEANVAPDFAGDAESTDEIETEFALRDEEPATNPAAAAAEDMSFAAAVSPSSSSARPQKKSAMPMILAVLLLLVVVGGATAGGLFFAGLLPGMGDGGSVANADGDEGTDGSSADSTPPSANDDLLKRLQAAEEKLLALYQTSRTGDQIDGSKLDEAQQILADLEANDEKIFNDENIQRHKSRFDKLVQDFKKQERTAAKEEKSRKFQEAYDFAAANAPKSLDEGALEEARKHANPQQLKLIEALKTQVAEYQAEQARVAMEESKQAAIDQIVAAVAAGNATQYGEMLNTFVADFPDAAQTADIQAVAKADIAGLDLVIQWNLLLTEWAGIEPQDVKAEDLTVMVAKAEQLLSAGASQLPGADTVSKRIEDLQGIAQRDAMVEAAKQKLMETFAAPPTKSTFVFATKDGKRYYTAEKPTKSGDNYAVNSFVDLEGKTESVELAPGDADRSATGAATVSATATAAEAAVQKIDSTNLDASLWEAIGAILADEKLDPVIKTQWLLVIAEAGQASPSMAKVLESINQLSGAGVDSNFNWADAEAAAKVRTACQESLTKLPSLDELKKAASQPTDVGTSFKVVSRIQPVGVLMKTEDGGWSLRRIETLDTDGEVSVFAPQAEKFALKSVGVTAAGSLTLHKDVDEGVLKTSRVVYMEIGEEPPPAEEAEG